MPDEFLTKTEVYGLLRKVCREAKGQARWGAQQEEPISASYITDVLNARRDPGEKILKALGLEAKVVYVKRRKAEAVDPAVAEAQRAQRRAVAQAEAQAIRASREARKAQA